MKFFGDVPVDTQHAAYLLAMVFLLGIFIPTASAQSRGKIAGTVTAADSGEPLPGVNLVIEGTTRGTSTDAQGDYIIANVEAGTYAVKASFVGYQVVTVEDVQVSGGQTVEIDIELRPATTELDDEVTVTADQPLVEADNTTSISRLRTEEIESRPTTDLTDILISEPSINEEGGQVTVRGGTLDQVSFLIDGARARDPLTHSPYTRINLGAIQEVEVITGAFNAEYGEAQSGVVNVITKEGGDEYQGYLDTRYEPAGTKHWGTSFYDRSSEIYWENTHARHEQWWIENTDQWVDPNGIPGSDPRSEWTPEEAYKNYLDTHDRPTDYTDIPTYQVEGGFGGPVPLVSGLSFFGTGKYRSEAPLFGNAYRDRGVFTDGTVKLTYRFGSGMKAMLSGFYGEEEAGWGFGDYPDYFWALNYGAEARYAYNDFEGYSLSKTNGQTLRFSHALSEASLYEIELSRVQALRQVRPFPDDPIGFSAADATRDNLRAVDSTGSPISGGYANRIGYHTTGYFYRHQNDNTEWRMESYFSSQLNEYLQVQTGAEFSYYRLDHYNESKFPARVDSQLYKPYQGALYAQGKAEYGGLVLNAGVRLDYYNPNDSAYVNLFNPLEGEKRETDLYWQLSPRLGVSHPIDEQTVLHFSYGHFFQRPPFNDYGEGNSSIQGNLNTFLTKDTEDPIPWVLGNRNLEPRKTIAYELGIERSFWDVLKLDLTGYYKDIRNTIRTITIERPEGTYRTNGNGDYADVRGVELSARKIPSYYSWGALWGYVNGSMQFGIQGRSGAPVVISPDGVRYAPSGDFIQHHNPHLKMGLHYKSPGDWSGLWGALLGNLSVSADYRANFPNDQLRSDYFLFEGEKHLRSVDQETNLRARKIIEVAGTRLSPYLEVKNLFNDKWLYLGAFEQASRADQQRFAESEFEYLPSRTADGTPILDVAKYRNLPRSITFGVKMEIE